MYHSTQNQHNIGINARKTKSFLRVYVTVMYLEVCVCVSDDLKIRFIQC